MRPGGAKAGNAGVERDGMRLTIFSIPKPFEGHIGVIQRNAVGSWRALGGNIEILLFGDEEGTRQVAEEMGLRHHAEVARNDYGTPLVDSLFAQAERLASSPILCYVNADIILMSDLIAALECARGLPLFLMVGKRTDLDISEPLDFSSPSWETELRARARREGRMRPSNWIDYFLFSRGLYRDSVPPFAVGRTAWDNWLVYHARRSNATVIDATSAVLAVHQNHGYKSGVISCGDDGKWEGPEVPLNRDMAGRRAVNYNIDDAPLVLAGNRLRRRRAVHRCRRFLVTRFPSTSRAMVAVARGLGFKAVDDA